MNNKIALIAKGEKPHDGSLMCYRPRIDYRARRENYEKAYTKDQLEYLFSHGLLEKYEPCNASWEYPGMGEYWQFTDKGKKLRNWYTSTYWDYLYYYVFHLYKVKYWWQKFRIKCGHHYDWQNYSGLSLDEI
jgi:hypothetical protein